MATATWTRPFGTLARKEAAQVPRGGSSSFRVPLRSIVTHLSPTTSLLRSSTTDNEVYLLGTAHVSDSSAEEAVDLIRTVRPQVVFLELDSSRAASLRNASGTKSGPVDPAAFRHLVDMIPPQMQQSFAHVSKVAPALLKRIGWLPVQGGDMKAAMDEADLMGLRCVYGDVEFAQTMKELKSSVMGVAMHPSRFANIPAPPSELTGIFGGLFSGQHDPEGVIEMIKTRHRAKQVTQYLRTCFPEVYHVMVSKRDEHMARMLRQHCASGKVVAVVGMAHVEGIEQAWDEMDAKQ